MMKKFIVALVVGVTLAGGIGKQGEAASSDVRNSMKLPGQTLATQLVGKKVMAQAFGLFIVISKCPMRSGVTLLDTRLISSPDGDEWREEWFFKVCSSQEYVVPIDFATGGDGDVQIHVLGREIKQSIR